MNENASRDSLKMNVAVQAIDKTNMESTRANTFHYPTFPIRTSDCGGLAPAHNRERQVLADTIENKLRRD